MNVVPKNMTSTETNWRPEKGTLNTARPKGPHPDPLNRHQGTVCGCFTVTYDLGHQPTTNAKKATNNEAWEPHIDSPVTVNSIVKKAKKEQDCKLYWPHLKPNVV